MVEPPKSLSGLLGPVPPRRARARLAAAAAGPFDAWSRSRAAAWCRPRSSRASSNCASIETVCIASYHDYKNQGGLQVLKTIADAGRQDRRRGARILVVDDLVDTGATAKVVREMLPKAHIATVYAKPLGPAAGRHVHHRSLAGHLDLFPLGHGPRLPAADRQGRRRLRRQFIFASVMWDKAARGRGETGRRKGLKILRPQGYAGSTPAVRTKSDSPSSMTAAPRPWRQAWTEATALTLIL